MQFDEGRPCWMDVTVKDTDIREGLMSFLSTLFGWTYEIGGPETDGYAIALSDGDPVAGLSAHPDGVGQLLTYFAVADIEAKAAQAADAGANIFAGPLPIPGSGTMAAGIDPSGAAFGLWQKSEFDGFGAYDRPNTPCWFDHQSTDTASASTFYAGVLGLQLEPVGPDGGGMLHLGAEPFASISPAFDGAPTALWAPLIMVSSLADTVASTTMQGGSVLIPEIPVPGGMAAALVAPVTGTVITVFQAAG